MIQDSVIPSVEIAHKLNLWYLSILNYEEEKARAMQNEIQSLLVRMEEDQNVLLYYSLLDFRFRVNYDAKQDLQHYHQQLENATESSDTLSLPLNYYYCLFSGDYEFRQGNYLKALAYYRKGLKQVKQFDDDIELAQCYYHLSEVYSILSYSVISVIYAQTALKIFDQHSEYVTLRIHCRNIFAANLVNDHCYDYALKLFSEARSIAQEKKDTRLSAIASFNIGIVYMHLKKYESAENFFKESLIIFIEERNKYIPRAYYSYYESLAEQQKEHLALQAYCNGLNAAIEWNDKEYSAKLLMLHALYEDPLNLEKIRSSLLKLKQLHLSHDIMEFSLKIAKKYKKLGNKDMAILFYELSNNARIHIIEGERINEKDLQSSWDVDSDPATALFN